MDDCEFGGAFNSTVLNGGIIINTDQELEMIRTVESFKFSKSGKSHIPIKYNLKDLKKFYDKYGIQDVYNKLIVDYDSFRVDLLNAIHDFDFKIVIGCIKSFNTNRLFINKTKDKVRRFAFTMCLMRFALEVQSNNTSGHLIFDFPTGSEPVYLNNEYASAYRIGSTRDKVPYKSGKLVSLGFDDSIKYSCTNYCTLLQITDIYLGAAKHFIEHIQGKEGRTFGYNLMKNNLDKFRGYPNKINTYGFVFDNGEGTRALKISVGRKIKELSYI